VNRYQKYACASYGPFQLDDYESGTSFEAAVSAETLATLRNSLAYVRGHCISCHPTGIIGTPGQKRFSLLFNSFNQSKPIEFGQELPSSL